MKATITGTLYAIDPIFSPDGYAKSVFGDLIHTVQYTVESNRMDFAVKKPVPFDNVSQFCLDLIPATSEGRKVEWHIRPVK